VYVPSSVEAEVEVEYRDAAALTAAVPTIPDTDYWCDVTQNLYAELLDDNTMTREKLTAMLVDYYAGALIAKDAKDRADDITRALANHIQRRTPASVAERLIHALADQFLRPAKSLKPRSSSGRKPIDLSSTASI
jgi:hypothetical protein